MVARYVHDGSSIDYRPTADVAAGDVVQVGPLFGIARLDIKAGELGSLSLTGVYDLPKPTVAAFGVGALVPWDTANNKVLPQATSTSPFIGIAVAENTQSDTTIRVLINGRTTNT